VASNARATQKGATERANWFEEDTDATTLPLAAGTNSARAIIGKSKMLLPIVKP
jgi:hypothetical protein